MQLGLPGAVLALGVVEIASDEARVQVLDHVSQPALGEQQHLISVRAFADLLGDAGDHRAAKDRQPFHERLERHALFGIAPGVLASLRVVLRPRQPRVGPEGLEQGRQEGGGHACELFGVAVPVALEEVGLDGRDRLGRDQPALVGDC